MAREFTGYVILRSPVDHQTVTFKPGDVVPEWAEKLVGDHATQGNTRAVQTSGESGDNDVPPVTPEDTTEVHTPSYEQSDDDASGDVDEDDEVPPYTEWSKTDLKAEAKGRELSGYSSATVEELIAMIEADDALAAEEE